MKGQTIIEVLVALGASLAILTAIAIAVISSLNNFQFTKNQNLANQYTKEGLAVVRQIAYSNWALFDSYNGEYCLDSNSYALAARAPGIAGCAAAVGRTGQNVGVFARTVSIARNDSSCLPDPTSAPSSTPPPGPTPTPTPTPIPRSASKVTVIVSWFDGACTDTDPDKLFCHQVKVSSCFFNTNVPIP